MPRVTTAGRELVRRALPPDLAAEAGRLDKKGLERLLARLAERGPDAYREGSHALLRAAGEAAEAGGGYGYGVSHLARPAEAGFVSLLARARTEKALRAAALTPDQRAEAVLRAAGDLSDRQADAAWQAALAAGSPVARQAASGARGNKFNVASLLASDLLYADHKDRPIPVPVFKSYAEGLAPHEYWAGAYGARKGVLAVKLNTAQAGYLAKVLAQAVHRLVVTADDDEPAADASPRGLPVDTDDPDNAGALLAAPAGGYPRNTPLTPKILADLKAAGHDQILVRSPAVGGPAGGGVFARDVGVREAGRVPTRGELVGLLASQALAEPISQGTLSSKHSGGVAGREKAVSGFRALEALVQVPKAFPGGAAVAKADGRVEAVEPAPAGGSYVTVAGERHYVPAGREVAVKPGDRVEAGDALSDGVPSPAEVVAHKGVGEGRRYFAHAFRAAMRAAGLPAHRRNVELLARGLIDRVELDAETDEHAPGDVVPYADLERAWRPRPGHLTLAPKGAVGRYLERPVLHYTVGTKVRPSVAAELARFGVDRVAVHPEPPPFRPVMVRGADLLQDDPDWMTRMYGSKLRGSLLDAAHRGLASDPAGTSFVPTLARGVDFARTGPVRIAPADRVKASAAPPDDPYGVPHGLAHVPVPGGYPPAPPGWRPAPRPAAAPRIGLPHGLTARTPTRPTPPAAPTPPTQPAVPPAPTAPAVPAWAAPAGLAAGVAASAGAGYAAGRVAPSLVSAPAAYGPVGRTLSGTGAVGRTLLGLPKAAPAGAPATATAGAARRFAGHAARGLAPLAGAVDAADTGADYLAGYRSGGAAGAWQAGRARLDRQTGETADALAALGRGRPTLGLVNLVPNPFAAAGNANTIAHAPGAAAEAAREVGERLAVETPRAARLGAAERAAAADRVAAGEGSYARYRDALAAGHPADAPWADPAEPGRTWTPGLAADHRAALARSDATDAELQAQGHGPLGRLVQALPLPTASVDELAAGRAYNPLTGGRLDGLGQMLGWGLQAAGFGRR